MKLLLGLGFGALRAGLFLSSPGVPSMKTASNGTMLSASGSNLYSVR